MRNEYYFPKSEHENLKTVHSIVAKKRTKLVCQSSIMFISNICQIILQLETSRFQETIRKIDETTLTKSTITSYKYIEIKTD